MASSHTRCKVCRVATVHKTTRFGLCPRHERMENERRRRERREAKLRKAARTGVAAPEEETVEHKDPPPISLAEAVEVTVRERDSQAEYARVLARMSDDRKLEIGAHYQDPRIPTRDITQAYGIGGGVLSALLKELGIDKRGPGRSTQLTQGTFVVVDGKQVWHVPGERLPTPSMNGTEPRLPEPQRVALENMMKLPAKPEPVAATPVPRLPPMLTFEVTVSGSFTMPALSMVNAITDIERQHPGLKVISIREA